MEDYKFQHELTPELRGQAALENQRLAFIAEFEDARTRLVTQLRRWLLCIGLLLLPAILNVLLPPVLHELLLGLRLRPLK